jgi:hypothetical protein
MASTAIDVSSEGKPANLRARKQPTEGEQNAEVEQMDDRTTAKDTKEGDAEKALGRTPDGTSEDESISCKLVPFT